MTQPPPHARHTHTRETTQADQNTWNNDGGNGLTAQAADTFFLGYHNQPAAVNSAFAHLKQDANNPDALKRDLASLQQAAETPSNRGDHDWREHFLQQLQAKMNGDTTEARQLRQAYNGQGNDNPISFDGSQMYIPPAPFNPQRSPASALPGARPGDSQVSPPQRSPGGGFDSTGYAQNAQGGQSFFREHDDTQNGIPTRSVRSFPNGPVDLKRGDQTITGVISEDTKRNLSDNSAEVTLNTDHGPVSYHQTPDGKIQYNAPTADQVNGLGGQKPGSPFLPTGSYSANGDMTPSPTNPNASSGWLGGSWNPFSGNWNNIAVNTEKNVDANGRVLGMDVTYGQKMFNGGVNVAYGADLSGMQVYSNRAAQNANAVDWKNVSAINYSWDANKGAYQMKVASGDGVKTYWTDGKKIYSDW